MYYNYINYNNRTHKNAYVKKILINIRLRIYINILYWKLFIFDII